MSDTTEELWSEFCTKAEVDSSVRDKWLGLIKSAYEGRICNDLEHLNSKLNDFKKYQNSLSNPLAVLAALVFQSIYYDTKSTENAEKSIEKFREFVEESSLNKELAERICELIELSLSNSTEEHKTDGVYGQEDQHYFLDINFAIFASDWEEYSKFSEKTREEYEFISDSAYNNLRIKVLQSFLQIPNIFATKEFREQYESQARENIQKEIDLLK